MTLLSVGGRVVVGRASFRRGGSVSGGLFTFRVPRQQLNHGVDSPDDQTGKAEKLQTHKNNYREAPKKVRPHCFSACNDKQFVLHQFLCTFRLTRHIKHRFI